MSQSSKAYDAISKDLFKEIPKVLIQLLTNQAAVRSETLEISEVKQRSPDLLLTLEDGSLLHIELQSHNDPTMPLRMIDYSLLIHAQFGQEPTQLVLYLGHAPMNMQATLQRKYLYFYYQVKDIREVDCEPLISSDDLSDNLFSLLCKNGTTTENLRNILQRIQKLPKAKRQDALVKVLFLSQLRKIKPLLTTEIEKMPIQMDLRDHPFVQAMIMEGKTEGETEEGRKLLRKLLQRRFGELPAWVEEKLAEATLEQLETWVEQVLDAETLSAVFI